MKDSIKIMIIILSGIIGILTFLYGIIILNATVTILGIITIILDQFFFKRYIGFHTAYNLFTIGKIGER